ncbi:hypothetical protein K437DRAFT_174585 [Tilletiaria anomala UBC 951]|uniref:TPR-like protein n=1 Tax=Tilletiaria anomala (strain ATCC 24038 / CBS 436.72 / UBC 951) TaxID=1037660 RepID=A0A066WF84_TILAU|nr:uncharacterized protein K437DRAFT_174585 [Tilletiaria anomala UBC 951]KDN52642.1 hypothetical protein K437DRAFT_174585 [Tilletiaria anomala UBC 951]
MTSINSPSRKSILAGMDSSIAADISSASAGGDLQPPSGSAFFSSTDGVLQRQKNRGAAADSQSIMSKGSAGKRSATSTGTAGRHSKNTSVSSKQHPASPSAGDASCGSILNGNSSMPNQHPAQPLHSQPQQDGDVQPKQQPARRISRLLRRKTSRDDAKASMPPMPKNGSANGNGNSYTNRTSSTRNGSMPVDDAASIKSKSSFRRISLKLPKFGGGAAAAAGRRSSSYTGSENIGHAAANASANVNANGQLQPPQSHPQQQHQSGSAHVPPIPAKYAQQARSSPHLAQGDPAERGEGQAEWEPPAATFVRTAAPGTDTSAYADELDDGIGRAVAAVNGSVARSSTIERPPRSPDRVPKPNFIQGAQPAAAPAATSSKSSRGDADDEQSGGYREYIATTVGTISSGTSHLVGFGGDDDETDGEDEFHDANDLSHISERSEDDETATPEQQQHRSHAHAPSHAEQEAQRLAADEEAHDAAAGLYPGRHRHRGQSAPPHAVPPRTPDLNDGGSTPVPACPRASISSGTAGGGRDRVTSISSRSEGRMKKETPEYVRTKAAAVAKLRVDDVQQSADELREDVEQARRALHLFLNSKMLEAEEIVKRYADRKLYYALGAALIAVIKGFMTFEPEDLAVAISFCKDTIHIAQLLRKPTNSVANFGRFVRGTGQSPSAMHSMTHVQRHAELVYAESVLLKAVMGILYSGDFFGFVAEALNMRNAYGIYRSLAKYVEWADEQASKKRRGAIDESIDEDFRSGVYLGNGLMSMILGLLPGKVLKIMEVFGYTGDCIEGLSILGRAGEWSTNPQHIKPGMPLEEEGIRRVICDMGILLYELVISTFMPVNGVDINYADKILHYNLDRYPQGIFFLYFSGRLYSTQTLAEKAIKQFVKARDVQREYIQLQHICWWDMCLCQMSLGQWNEAYSCFEVLLNDSNWSKAVYNYGKGVNLYSSDPDGKVKEAGKIIIKTPDLMQRIAGKSIPLEKFVARKAKKFQEQGRLLLPALEFSYFYHCVSNAPRYILADEHLVTVSQALRQVQAHESEPASYHSGEDEFWDDYCLAHFLRAVTLKYIAHPEQHAKARPRESPIPKEEAEEQAEMSLKNVIANGTKLTTDHYLLYFAHYELGRLYASMGRKSDARDEFNLILSGKNLGDKGREGKYSMQVRHTPPFPGPLSVFLVHLG